jgi:hypothetical protein
MKNCTVTRAGRKWHNESTRVFNGSEVPQRSGKTKQKSDRREKFYRKGIHRTNGFRERRKKIGLMGSFIRNGLLSLTLITLAFAGAFVILPQNPNMRFSTASVEPWIETTSLPNNQSSSHCVTYGGYIYCVDGQEVYFANLTSSGVGNWTETSSYPLDLFGQACAASGGYIYCVGGVGNDGPRPNSSVFYALLSSSGVGR